jgi:hypothetical protein
MAERRQKLLLGKDVEGVYSEGAWARSIPGRPGFVTCPKGYYHGGAKAYPKYVHKNLDPPSVKSWCLRKCDRWSPPHRQISRGKNKGRCKSITKGNRIPSGWQVFVTGCLRMVNDAIRDAGMENEQAKEIRKNTFVQAAVIWKRNTIGLQSPRAKMDSAQDLVNDPSVKRDLFALLELQ